ncbi:MAG TPA: serine/threonine-protein kinase [Burkholderiales bacterium]|nr:serine/threonine-protein kinase [Burkholderiales bacterium]
MMAQPNPLERYKILNELGRGAIGRVYAARDRSTGAVVALKTLDPELFSEPGTNFAELFLKSARSAGLLRHRNIVRVYDAGEADGTAYIAMELLEGESLRHMLDDRPLSIARAIQIFDDIASALAYAHEEGVVHRGVKPSNIIVLRSGVAKIGDFGIGQLGEAALRYGQRGGCLSYMSPEQVRGDPVDHRSDLFSLGAVFYEMLTRQALFEGSSPKQIMENILHAEPPLPSKVNPHVPFAVDRIVFGMVAEHPDDRFANARVLLRELQRLEEELGLGPGASAGTNEPTASVPPGRAEVRLETSRFPQRGQPEPAAPQAATEREPILRISDPHRFRDPAPMQDEPRFAQQEFPNRNRISGGEAFDEHDSRFLMDREPEPERSSGSRTATVAALTLMFAVLSIGLTFILYYSPGPGEPRTSASRLQEPPATAAAPSPSTAPPPAAVATPPPEAEATKEPATGPASPEASPPPAAADARAAQESSGIASAPNPLPPKPAVAEPSPSTQAQTESPPARESRQAAAARAAPAQAAPRAAQESSRIASAPKPLPPKPAVAEPSPSTQAQTESPPARESGQPATARAAPAQAAPRAAQPTAKISEPQPGGTATLIIAVSPQGELYVDGKHYGTTPPITTLDLKPGMHHIEIRSGSRKPYVTYVMVEPGAKRLLRHDFAAKPSRPAR